MPSPSLQPLQPASIQPIGEELAIVWSDGAESYFSLEKLRRACPCALCAGEADVLGKVIRPAVTHGPHSFRLRSWQIVGGYAWQPFWEDGHQSGIYSWALLRRI